MESVGRRSLLVVNVLASFSGLGETSTALAVVCECDVGVASLVTARGIFETQRGEF